MAKLLHSRDVGGKMGSQIGESNQWLRHPSLGRGDMREHSGLVEATPGVAYGVWRDILVGVWRQCPTFAEAERQCDTLARLAETTDTPGLWLVTEPACEIPSVSVRRLIAMRLRRLKPLRVFAVCVQAEHEAEAALMRAAIRMMAVAGGTKAAHFGVDVASVAAQLAAASSSVSSVWGERAVRILTRASGLAASIEMHRVEKFRAGLHGAGTNGAALHGADSQGADSHGAGRQPADLHGSELRDAGLGHPTPNPVEASGVESSHMSHGAPSAVVETDG